MRKEYEITDEEVATIKEAYDNSTDATREEARNAAWIVVGKAHGFKGMTARPVDGFIDADDIKHLTAEEVCDDTKS